MLHATGSANCTFTAWSKKQPALLSSHITIEHAVYFLFVVISSTFCMVANLGNELAKVRHRGADQAVLVRPREQGCHVSPPTGGQGRHVSPPTGQN